MPTYLPLHPLLLLLLLLAAFSPPSLLTKAGWVDPDSPHSVQRTHSLRDPNLPSLRLVMSDEFNVAARTFADGHDPTWTAGDHSDDARTSVGKGALIYYNHSYASTTEEGHLKITTTSELTQWKGFNPFTQKYEIFEKEFRGAMVNTWNKFCFSGGVVEASLKLPGPSDVGLPTSIPPT
ncbi:Beta-glucan synthesis-associated, SKN1 [Nannochloropsis gaditana]|uniref:Beta-glucan synthesis-associated, SKN1 n=1 Tax=Nannochloropsis gaditana TaxID=72520 RepID=W7TCX8_9STRA|nr:Beta-glucan synthesis-associated, SKN1 [Nannochloropsis gaditana]